MAGMCVVVLLDVKSARLSAVGQSKVLIIGCE